MHWSFGSFLSFFFLHVLFLFVGVRAEEKGEIFTLHNS